MSVTILRPRQRVYRLGDISSMTEQRPSIPAAAAVPWSLDYALAAPYVDCGTDASIVGLNAGAFTVDVYWRCPPLTDLGNYVYYSIISQGDVWWFGGTQGWGLQVQTTVLPGAVVRFTTSNGSGTRSSSAVNVTLSEGTWYYVRGRHLGLPGWSNYCYVSVNAGAEGSQVMNGPGATSAEPLYHGRLGGATPYYLKENVCYAHVWDTNKGTLGSVPTSPFAVDGNTAARWIHSDGSGLTLTDDSGNGNHGSITGCIWTPIVPGGWTI